MPLVILHHLLNVPVQLANKRGFKQKNVMLLPTFSRPCCLDLVVKPHLKPRITFLLLSDSCGFVDAGPPL
jgi:hypothetical protein